MLQKVTVDFAKINIFVTSLKLTVRPRDTVYIRGSQRDVVDLVWPIASSYLSPNAGEGGGLRALSQWVQLCTCSPNKLWRSNSIFNLWFSLTRRSLWYQVCAGSFCVQTTQKQCYCCIFTLLLVLLENKHNKQEKEICQIEANGPLLGGNGAGQCLHQSPLIQCISLFI